MEFFDLIADQFKAGKRIIDGETAWSYRQQLDSTPEGPERERMSRALEAYDDYQHKHKEDPGEEQDAPNALEKDHGVTARQRQNPTITAQDPSAFTDVTCLKYFTMKVPKNWWVLGSDLNATINTTVEATAKVIDVTLPPGKVTIIRANSKPQSIYAGVCVEAVDPLFSLQEYATLDLSELERKENNQMQRGLAVMGGSILTPCTITKEVFDSIPALVYNHKLRAANGDVHCVEMVVLLFQDKHFLITLGYREPELMVWKPVIQYMRQSIQRAVEVRKAVPVTEPEIRRAIPVAPPKASNRKPI